VAALFNPSVLLVALGLLLGSFGFGYFKGSEHERSKATNVLLKATEKARETEQNWATNVAALEEVHADEVRTIAAQRDAALAGLRNRPERPMSAASAPSAQYATGANLYRDDAAFLVGLASRADGLRAALDRCETWIAQVTSGK
jgi:hypothetical protein